MRHDHFVVKNNYIATNSWLDNQEFVASLVLEIVMVCVLFRFTGGFLPLFPIAIMRFRAWHKILVPSFCKATSSVKMTYAILSIRASLPTSIANKYMKGLINVKINARGVFVSHRDLNHISDCINEKKGFLPLNYQTRGLNRHSISQVFEFLNDNLAHRIVVNEAQNII